MRDSIDTMDEADLLALVNSTSKKISDTLKKQNATESDNGVLLLENNKNSRITRTTLSTEIQSGFDPDSLYIKPVKTDHVNTLELDAPVTVPKDNFGRTDDLKLDTRLVKSEKDTTGPGWFNMPATEVTPEIKKDLQLIRLRGYVDPKRFYKNNDWKAAPKYFQIGTVVEGATEFYSSRMTNKEKAPTLVDELLRDDQARTYLKHKFRDLQQAKMSTKGGKKFLKQRTDKRTPAWKKWARK